MYSALFTLIGCSAFAQTSKTQQMAIVLKRQIERNHYSPRAVNDSFSSDMFSKILGSLDAQQNIFTSDDYAALSGYRSKLDDEVNGGEWKFLDLVTDLYRQRLKNADSTAESVLAKPLDFSADDKITFTKEQGFRFSSSSELRTRWTRWFKFLVLNGLYDIHETDSLKPGFKSVLDKNESIVREKIKKISKKKFQEILHVSTFENYMKEVYLNALATSFDPHTMYLSIEGREDLQSQLSTEDYSFGFKIDETGEGKIIIAHLVPGGPAWKSGELHANDELLQIQWAGKPPVDIPTLTYEETADLLNGSNHGSVFLKLRKTNGAIQTVTLQKEKINTEENLVKGYVLKGEKKIGYISLPDFYTVWEEGAGSSCANDVAKEIIKLKREKIDGLILDVRFNGGGSLEEALQMAGIFIDEGPLTGTKDRSGKVVFLKDPNRGTIYDGPLILLINGQSASASELLAAVLQDYNRAIVVGSASYGKATMQAIFPMDSLMQNPSAPSPNGYVKITTGKLYRVTGQTAQLNGVLPDIHLPDAFDALQYREKFSQGALAQDTVKRNAYFKPLNPLSVHGLQQLSDQRINSNKDLKNIKEVIRKATQNEKAVREVPLKFDGFEKWAVQNRKEEIIMGVEKRIPTSLFTAQTYKHETQGLPGDDYTKTIDEIILKNIQKDIYIEEAYGIVIDLIKSKAQN